MILRNVMFTAVTHFVMLVLSLVDWIDRERVFALNVRIYMIYFFFTIVTDFFFLAFFLSGFDIPVSFMRFSVEEWKKD